MKKLFLASLFKDVSQIFVDFANENLIGKTVTFIPTAALPDKLDFHIKHSIELLSKMGLIVDELEISTAVYLDIVNKLENNDYIYVTGGNTFFLLQEMNRSGAGNLIKAQIDVEREANCLKKGTDRVSVVLHCADDDYRFDFLLDGILWKLAFVECITLPVYDLNIFPYTEFAPLGKKELHIRREKEISQFVYFYLKFKELVGKEKALAYVSDGKGEYICARSWVPFYSDRLSYIAYFAWYECRINGENVVIREFQENKCEVVIYSHIWRSMYFMVGHLKAVIEYSEYMELFEYVCKDRAASADWKISFVYTNESTVLVFNKYL